MAADTPTDPLSPADGPSIADIPESDETERRRYTRVRPDAQNPLAAKLTSGADVRLIDLSRGGAQFECDRRFLPNATVSLRLMTRDDAVMVSGRVVRSRLVRLETGGLGYVVAVAFNDALKIPIEPHGESGNVVDRGQREPQKSDTAADSNSAAVGAADDTDADRLAETDAAHTMAAADISEEEALAFESALETMPPMFTLTATVDATSEQLRDMFDGNDW